MSIYEAVSEQLKDAMRARDKVRVNALRNIRAGFIAALKEDNSASLTDEASLAVLRRLQKQRQESIEAYAGAGREDLAEAERAELVVIDAFLPKLADEDTTRAWVQAAIASSGASAAGDLGKVMGAIMRAHRDEIDGKLANRIARELLA